MPQIFRPAANTIAKASIVGTIVLVTLACWGFARLYSSPFIMKYAEVRDQPVPFSHEHHVSGLGIDCRYCHTSVEKSSFAGLPATKVCMSCHSQIWTNAALLAPVRESWNTNTPIQWTRVHNLPQFVYFDHSIHIAKGVGCATCHGQVQDMPMMMKAHTFTMAWCLQCHREPEQFLRKREEVFNMNYTPPKNQLELGKELVKDYHVNKEQLINCSVCHR